MFVAVVAAIAPVVELVGSAEVFHLRVQSVGAVERYALTGMHGIGRAIAG